MQPICQTNEDCWFSKTMKNTTFNAFYDSKLSDYLERRIYVGFVMQGHIS